MVRLICRNLGYYWRTNGAVVAGVATAVAVLAGALLVGQSVRASLRDLVFQRLGAAEYVVSSDRFFRAELADEFAAVAGAGAVCPVICVPGVVIHEATGARALHVNVFGVDERFWKFHGFAGQENPEGRSALVGAPLAVRLGDLSGELLLRLESGRGIPRESLFGRRENTGRTLRLAVSGILPTERLGEFALRPGQGDMLSIFVPLQRLQKDLGQPGGANTILLSAGSRDGGLEKTRKILEEKFTLEDAGVRLRPLPEQNAIAVESARVLLDDTIARAALDAAAHKGWEASGIFTYLANSIRARGREIPYSAISAVDLGRDAMAGVHATAGVIARDERDAIWLNEWSARDLGVAPGDDVEIDYYLWQEDGRLVTRSARFHLAGILAMGAAVDAALAPEFPGITTARSIREWDPPFALDLRRIRPRDEDYWGRYRAAPKAFVSLATGQLLWQSRFGKLSSVRIALPAGTDAAAATAELAQAIRKEIRPESAGFSVDAVKQRSLEASRGSTDFGEYFLYFSFFLIVSAILLAALFFRLGIEQRVREIGTLQALGFPVGAIRRMFLWEGGVLAVAGSLAGLLGAVGYGALLMSGLRTWWIGAVGTRRLFLHVSWPDLLLGAASGIVIAPVVIAWTLRGLTRNSPRALLAGVLESISVRVRRARVLGITSGITFAAAILLLAASALKKVADVAAFFGAGSLLLVSLLCLTALHLRRRHPAAISGRGARAWFRLGARSTTHRPGRSLLCVALIASATFMVVSVEAFRQDPSSVSLAPKSGTGGYPLIAESALPIVYDPNSAAGREALSIPPELVPELAGVKFVSFRERPGDDASCLNLYAPQEPRILGAPRAFLTEGRFAFAEAAATSAQEKENPWLLLESELPGGVLPAIGDANTIRYILHLDVGSELTVRGDGGKPVRLRLVAALRGSVLQGELVISEANFLRAFPDREGYRFFLLDAPPAQADAVVRPLMERLADWGFQVESTRARLASYHKVENTYLSTFQSLGALGLVLGTVGLAAVLLRNVLERRQELALLRAIGYRRQVLATVIVAENAVLMVMGLACGLVCALLAIAPALSARGGTFPAIAAILILAAVLAVGLAASVLAVTAALRSPLLASLRSE
jgi:ABC-type lipoprotein release transport system permease subunit